MTWFHPGRWRSSGGAGPQRGDTEPSLVAHSARRFHALRCAFCFLLPQRARPCSVHVASAQTDARPLMWERSAADVAGFSHLRGPHANFQPPSADRGWLAGSVHVCACVGSSGSTPYPSLHLGEAQTGSLKIESGGFQESCCCRCRCCWGQSAECLTQAGNSATCSCFPEREEKVREKCTHARVLTASCTVAYICICNDFSHAQSLRRRCV